LGGRPPRPILPLRARLLAGLIALTALFLLIMGAVSTVVLSDHLAGQLSAELLAAVVRPLPQLEAAPDYALAELEPGGSIQPVQNGSAMTAQLVTELGQLPRAQLVQDMRRHETFALPGTSGEAPLRGAARLIRADAPGGTGVRGVLVVAQGAGGLNSQVHGVVIAELITGGALIALLALGGRWLISRGLAPIDQMATTANQITTRGDLTARMPDPGDQAEVGRLAAAINAMLDRIQQAFGARLRSEQKVRQFAADASHELRTPLTTIRGYAELYRQGALGPGELPTAMRRIEQEAQRMSRLVAELLELARLDRTSSLDLSETDLAALVRDAVADARAVEPGRPVRAEVPDRLVVVADEPRIRQVLANLLGNVRAHTPPSTPTSVELTELAWGDDASRPPKPPAGADHGVLLEVADAGPGMSAENAARAFDRFHRGTRAANGADGADAAVGGPDSHVGSGLGLSIVQAIAIAHGGKVTLESAPGHGTRIRVWLPARTAL